MNIYNANNKIVDAYYDMLKFHENQVRKVDNEQYCMHPARVARYVSLCTSDANVLIAALLHDTIEDSDASFDFILNKYGKTVAEYVKTLTENKNLSWKVRKLQYIDNVSNACTEIKNISIADKIDNLQSIIKAHILYGDKIWEKFNAPKEEQLWFYLNYEKEVVDKDENIYAYLYKTYHTSIDEFKSIL